MKTVRNVVADGDAREMTASIKSIWSGVRLESSGAETADEREWVDGATVGAVIVVECDRVDFGGVEARMGAKRDIERA